MQSFQPLISFNFSHLFNAFFWFVKDYGADALVELPVDVSKPDEVSDVGSTRFCTGFPWEVREVWTERGLFDRKRQQPTTILYIYIYYVVVSSIFYFHPYLGKIPILTNIFQLGWNRQPVYYIILYYDI